MLTVYKDEQLILLSERVGLTKKAVKDILDEYINRIHEKVNVGETVKFLGVCYLSANYRSDYTHETLAYVSTEIGEKLSVSGNTVYRVLADYEDMIVSDVGNYYTYVIRGIIKISSEELYLNGIRSFKLRLNTSGALRDKGYRVFALNSFRRKVEERNDRKNSQSWRNA